MKKQKHIYLSRVENSQHDIQIKMSSVGERVSEFVFCRAINSLIPSIKINMHNFVLMFFYFKTLIVFVVNVCTRAFDVGCDFICLPLRCFVFVHYFYLVSLCALRFCFSIAAVAGFKLLVCVFFHKIY